MANLVPYNAQAKDILASPTFFGMELLQCWNGPCIKNYFLFTHKPVLDAPSVSVSKSVLGSKNMAQTQNKLGHSTNSKHMQSQ